VTATTSATANVATVGREAVLVLGLRDLRPRCTGSVALIALVSIVAVAGCGGGRVDKNSDAYSDGEACGRIYALSYNGKTMKPISLSETVFLCQWNHNLYKTPGGSGTKTSYVAGVKDAYRRAKEGE
jgi:hypothetical protein